MCIYYSENKLFIIFSRENVTRAQFLPVADQMHPYWDYFDQSIQVNAHE